jgi:RHS repeat-associated protein
MKLTSRRIALSLLLITILTVDPLPSHQAKLDAGIKAPSIDLSSPVRAIGSFLGAIPHVIGGVARWLAGPWTTHPAAAQVQEWPPPPGRQELVELRTANAKFFREPDGRSVGQFYSAPIHFRSVEGVWEEIDTTLVPSTRVGFLWRISRGPVTIEFAPLARPADTVSLTSGSESLTFGPLEGAPSAPVVEGSRITYPNVWPDTDLVYEVLPQGLKETVVMRRDPGLERFRFSFGGSLRLASASGGRLSVRNTAGQDVWGVPAPMLTESPSEGRPSANGVASFSLSGLLGLQVVDVLFDRAFLQSPLRVWPVLLDPTVEIDQSDGTYVDLSQSGLNFNSSAELQVGAQGGLLTKRTLIEFPHTGDWGTYVGKQIVYGTLNLRQWGQNSCTAKQIDVHRVTQSWNPDSVSWNTLPTVTTNAVAWSSIGCPSGGWAQWDVTSAVQYVADHQGENWGFEIKANSEGDPLTWKRFRSENYSVPSEWPYLYVQYNTGPPNPTLLTPSTGAILKSTRPVLTTSTVTDPDGDPVYYQVEIDNDSDFSSPTWRSDWQPLTPTITVPVVLDNNTVYYWHARASDEWEQGNSTYENGWTSSRSFTYQNLNLGSRDYWPMWSQGPLTVNQGTGNLVLSVPGPAYPTATGSIGAAATYNLFDTEDRGLGAGWVLDVGETLGSPPTKLIDHNHPGAANKYAAAEIIYPEGQPESYPYVPGSNTYKPPPGDFSELKKNTDNQGSTLGWTLLDEDGSLYLFGPPGTDGTAVLTGAEVVDAAAGIGKVVYSFNTFVSPPRITKISYKLQETPTLIERSLTFTWNALNPNGCQSAIVCILGPDGVSWRYIGETTTGGRLQTISDGTRNVFKITYDASGRPSKIQNANDLDPANASPGYDPNHSTTIGYDGSARVASISDGPVTNQTPPTSTWTFTYVTGGSGLTAPGATHAYSPARLAWGYTETNPPSTTLKTRVYYDGLRRTMETRDVFGNKMLYQYNELDQLAWVEERDPAGQVNPTDNEYDPLTHVLTKVTAPDPDGTGSLQRAQTRYRYDEMKIGTTSAPGNPLRGLQGTYFPNKDLAGKPAVRRHDPQVAFDWAGIPEGYDGLPMPGMPADDFSVRWTGYVNLTANNYWFATDTGGDGGTRLTIDGSLMINSWNAGGLKESPKIYLSSGWHQLSLEYWDDSGVGKAYLAWRWGTQPLATIPQANLMPAWNNQTSVIDPGNHISFKHYAAPATAKPDYALNKLLDDTNVITSYEYDTAGRLTRKVMPKGNTGRTITTDGDLQGVPDLRFATTWAYYGLAENAVVPLYCGIGTAVNQAGMLKSVKQNPTVSDAQTAPVVNVYDQAGRVVAVTRGAGSTCSLHDAEGRLTDEWAPGDAYGTIHYLYDPAGQVRNAFDGGGSVATVYNEAGLPKSGEDVNATQTTLSYNAQRRPTFKSVYVPNVGNFSTTMSYDDEGKIKTLTVQPGSKTFTFWYDFRGNLKAVQTPNATFSWRDYNNAGWLTGLYNRHGTLSDPLPGTAPPDTNAITNHTYTYNDGGKTTQQTRSGGSLTTQTESYQYDESDRLRQVTIPSSPINVVRVYSYDLDSNRTGFTENGATVGTYIYDPNTTPGVDQLTTAIHGLITTTYAYDSDGNVIARGTDTLSWDARGRLTGGTFAGSQVTYRFDAVGRRKQRTAGSSTTNYLYAGDDSSTVETNEFGAAQNTSIAGPAGDLARYSGIPNLPYTDPSEYLYYNGHGDLAAAANTSGARTYAYTYDPFGAPRETVPTNTATERWTGQWDKKLDTQTNLIQMGVRPYDPLIGRFLAVDPVEGGSLNNYDYAGQDPINAYDLDGSRCWTPKCVWRRYLRRVRVRWGRLFASLAAIAAGVVTAYYAFGMGGVLLAAALFELGHGDVMGFFELGGGAMLAYGIAWMGAAFALGGAYGLTTSFYLKKVRKQGRVYEPARGCRRAC